MDCLDPPLTAMPAGKWMCPNHMEHVVLTQKNMTLSSRCQLFDHFQDRMSQHAVKVDFLRRVHRQNPPNRRGVHPHRKRTLKVPESIKSQYKSPPDMLAPAGIRDGELICTGVAETPEMHPKNTPRATSEAEQQEWLRDVITLQCSIMRHLSRRRGRGLSSRWDLEPAEKPDMKPCVAPPEESVSLCSTGQDSAPSWLPRGTRPLPPPRAPQDTAVARLASATPPSDGKGSPHASGGLSGSMKGVTDGDGELELSHLDERLIRLPRLATNPTAPPPQNPPCPERLRDSAPNRQHRHGHPSTVAPARRRAKVGGAGASGVLPADRKGRSCEHVLQDPVYRNRS
ncbi:hypothetical protein SKAU_G00425420 [Synaphobranchus kaupii]|uniref:Uncharacterized protein n=1 Tax=Synaphobranchus kaupii TaxID=118154 RepID=A0A9Q1E5T3_SYNKA|nr:hypothetical protein SKAU_G00425420 [Synaphobranchus kaupii]